MNNRFNELSVANQLMVSALINTVAANSHVEPRKLVVILADAIEAAREEGRAAMTLEESERCDYCTAPHTDCVGGVAYHCDDHEAEAAADAYPEDAR